MYLESVKDAGTNKNGGTGNHRHQKAVPLSDLAGTL